ncbi:hypothetical protein MMC10_007740 [Thelotrema lepadinum]|nr:hypothetical protein [Thelotrema lepadinum]
MSKGATCRLRPTKQGGIVDLKDVFKVHIPQATLKALDLMSGQICQLELPDGGHVQGRAAVALPDVGRGVVQVTQAFKEMHGLKFEESYVVKRAEATVELVKSVTIVETSGGEGDVLTMDTFDSGYWCGWVCRTLMLCKDIAVNMPLGNLQAESRARSFRITEITALSGDRVRGGSLCRFTETSTLTMKAGDAKSGTSGQLEIETSGIAGLEGQLALLKETVESFGPSRIHNQDAAGVLLHGPSGTGKTLVLDRVAAANWKRVLRPKFWATGISSRSAPKAVEEAFIEATRHQPTLIILDDLERLSQDSGNEQPLVNAIKEGFETIKSCRVLVLAAAKDVRTVPSILRQPSLLDEEIYLPIPDANVRIEILSGLFASRKNVRVERHLIDSFGYRTHGYNGADFVTLRRLAIVKAGARTSNPVLDISNADLELALQRVKPSAMNEVFLDIPKTRWADIAGQESLKEALKEAVEWPLNLSKDMKRLGIPPSKGMLLYGPPGCSKTLTASAIANETGLNFFAVKGAQILNMYVGESERNIRDLFAKARAAQPSIIFLDEIEAIGATRQDGGSGVHTLTTLLNELDGIEPLKGVFVLAATNQPWILDPALVRPGRLDQAVYVPLPDEATRKSMFELRLKNAEHADDVDVDWLARNSKGCSGAEVVEACTAAGRRALREAQREKLPQEEIIICQRHFIEVMKDVRPRVTVEMVEAFEAWSKGSKK